MVKTSSFSLGFLKKQSDGVSKKEALEHSGSEEGLFIDG